MTDQDTPTKATTPLTLKQLRDANIERAELWRQGAPPTSLSFSLIELAGEAGEACNEGKKLERERLGLVGGKTDTAGLAEELADVVICADLAAITAGIDLMQAVRDKFNKTIDKHGFLVKLGTEETTPGRLSGASDRAAPESGADREVVALLEALHEIHDTAHQASSGPEIHDVMWDIRMMADVALRDYDAPPAKRLPPAARPNPEVRPEDFMDAAT